MNLSAASDLLNPVLVKELRQGLKSRAFGFSFMLIQALMVCALAIQCAAIESPSVMGRESGVFFWIFTGAPLLVILPLLAINAIYSEHKQNTLALVLLTHLTPWRMVLGKWTALMAQCGLIATAILPYLVLRYFLGGVNVAMDVLTLALLVGGSGLFCAGGLLLSTVKNPWRALWIGVAIFIFCSPLLIGLALPLILFFAGTSARPGFFPLQLFLAAAALLHWAAGRYANYVFHARVAPRINTILLLFVTIAAIQIAGKFSPTYLALPILLPALVSCLLGAAALAVPSAAPRHRALTIGIGTATLLLASTLTGTIPGPGPLYFFATFATALAFPAYLVLALRRWINPFVPMLVFVEIMALLVGGVTAAVFTNEFKTIPAALHVVPVLSFLITTFDKADASFLTLNLVLAAASIAALLWQFRNVRRATAPVIG